MHIVHTSFHLEHTHIFQATFQAAAQEKTN